MGPMSPVHAQPDWAGFCPVKLENQNDNQTFVRQIIIVAMGKRTIIVTECTRQLENRYHAVARRVKIQ